MTNARILELAARATLADQKWTKFAPDYHEGGYQLGLRDLAVRIIRALYLEMETALDDYWAAQTPTAERLAYHRMRDLGFPPAYGEAP